MSGPCTVGWWRCGGDNAHIFHEDGANTRSLCGAVAWLDEDFKVVRGRGRCCPDCNRIIDEMWAKREAAKEGVTLAHNVSGKTIEAGEAVCAVPAGTDVEALRKELASAKGAMAQAANAVEFALGDHGSMMARTLLTAVSLILRAELDE